MPLKLRGERIVYYRNRREGGRVRSEYVASGIMAVLADELDDDERQARQEWQQRERQVLRDWIATDDREREQVRAVACEARQRAHQHLTALGFYRDPRRRWRLPKMSTAPTTATPETPAPPVRRGDPAAGRLAISHPRALGANVSITQHLASHWVEDQRARILDDLDTYVQRLAGPGASGAVQSLAEAAGVTWLRLRLLEIGDSKAEKAGGRTIQRMTAEQHRIAQERRQLADLIESIARVRRLESRAPSNVVNVVATGPTMIGAPPVLTGSV